MDAQILLRSDHKPLEKFLQKNTLNSKVNNWAMELEAFNIEFDYIKGPNNVLADTMSRLVDINPDTQQHPEGPRYEFSYAVFEEFPEVKTNTYEVSEVIVGTQKEIRSDPDLQDTMDALKIDNMPYDKDNDDMPYDKDNDNMPQDRGNDDMPDDNDNDQMPDKYANDNDTAITEVRYVGNMTNDEFKDIGTKDMVLYKRDDTMMTKVKQPIETSDIDDQFIREYDDMCKSMEYRQINDYYEAWRHIQSAMKGDTPLKIGQNRQCIDNVSDYNREHDRILNSVCHRLDLGPNMLPGAQQHTTVESAAALTIQDKIRQT